MQSLVLCITPKWMSNHEIPPHLCKQRYVPQRLLLRVRTLSTCSHTDRIPLLICLPVASPAAVVADKDDCLRIVSLDGIAGICGKTFSPPDD